ncbi:MAG: hypothetical protein QME64_04580 [bacterium]|nr:hypothetical protein [bacterium]
MVQALRDIFNTSTILIRIIINPVRAFNDIQQQQSLKIGIGVFLSSYILLMLREYFLGDDFNYGIGWSIAFLLTSLVGSFILLVVVTGVSNLIASGLFKQKNKFHAIFICGLFISVIGVISGVFSLSITSFANMLNKIYFFEFWGIILYLFAVSSVYRLPFIKSLIVSFPFFLITGLNILIKVFALNWR